MHSGASCGDRWFGGLGLGKVRNSHLKLLLFFFFFVNYEVSHLLRIMSRKVNYSFEENKQGLTQSLWKVA